MKKERAFEGERVERREIGSKLSPIRDSTKIEKDSKKVEVVEMKFITNPIAFSANKKQSEGVS